MSNRGRSWLQCDLLALCIMRVCMSINFNAVRNIQVADYTLNSDTNTCIFHAHNEGEPNANQVWIYLVEFFLPALGGLACDKWFGELRVLQVSGALLLISGFYFTSVEMLGMICKPAALEFGLVPNSLAYGIGVAPLVVTPLKISEGRYGSPIPGLVIYYSAAALGEFIGFLPHLYRSHLNITWLVSLSPVVFMMASFTLELDWTEYFRRVGSEMSEFVFPTRARFLRYFVMLAPLVLITNVIAMVRGATYCLELNFYLNCTGNCTAVTCSEVFGAYNISTIATMLSLGALYNCGYLRGNGRINTRFYAGTAILVMSKAAFIGWHLWAGRQSHQLPDPMVVHSVYGVASAVDGVSNGLALASGYELIFRVGAACNKNLVMGLLFTMWAISACIAGVTFLSLRTTPAEHPEFGDSRGLYIAYVIASVESAVVIVFYYFVIPRLSRPLMIEHVQSVEDDSSSVIEDQGYDSTDESRALLHSQRHRYGFRDAE